MSSCIILWMMVFSVWNFSQPHHQKEFYGCEIEHFMRFLHVCMPVDSAWIRQRTVGSSRTCAVKSADLCHFQFQNSYSSSIYFVPKHVTVLQKMRLALLASIPLASLISSEVLSCAHGADMLLDMLEKCQVVSVRIPSLFQQNVLKAVGRTQIE